MCHENWQATPAEADAPTPCLHTHIDIPVADGALPTDLYEPPGGTALAAPCVIIPDVYGTVPFYHELAGRLAAAGHPTALVDIFWREGALPLVTREAALARRAEMDEPQAILDCSTALDTMQARCGSDRAGLIGFCLGGMFAFVLAAARDDLAVVSYYGFPEGVPAPVRVPAPRPIDLAPEMSGPILSFWGEDDYIGTDVMDRFGEALAAHGVDYEAHIYPGAGHGFLQGLVEDRSDSIAAVDSWRRTLATLTDTLGGGGP